MESHQEEGDGRAQDETGQDVRAVVAVLGHAVEAGQEGGAQRDQAQHRLGQPAGLGPDGAGDVHLEERSTLALKTPRDPSPPDLHPSLRGRGKGPEQDLLPTRSQALNAHLSKSIILNQTDTCKRCKLSLELR